ncbi:hypothetical protein AVEN_119250-1 [Araneus ventricosus]|uniref:HAT C-terminal dimerisation domain-containing protein n=1 Tax=Araneus ventricosus TaxID=182803 RepID=A0A4Y2WBN2_ARAVE|nr:hypothetical protein AVEN_119250-1 [Araneus ventricosus]
MSTLRREALLNCIKTTLKRHCDIRWSSRRQAVTALQKNLPSVHKLLQHMTDRANNWITDTASGAMILLRQIDYEFVCLLEIWSVVLVKLDCTNKSLQEKSATLDVASSLLSGLAKNIQHLHDEGVHKYAAKNVCDSMSIKSSFTHKRLKKVKGMAGEMAGDEVHLICAEKSFELECFKLYDRLISEIKSRSDIYHTISSDFSFLSGKASNESSISYLGKCAADFGAKYNRDIDTLKLVNEVATSKFRVKELVKNISTTSLMDILKVISKYGLRNAYPNIETALRIFMTMHVNVAPCELSFGKLKVIKNYLR